MKNQIKIIGVFVLIILGVGCSNHFLDRTPLDQVSEEDFFQTPDDLEIYVNQFYNNSLFPPLIQFGLDLNSDNSIFNNFDTRLAGTLTLDDAAAISFAQVRSINYFFDNYKKIKEDYKFEDYQQFVGEAYFFRALIYFRSLRDYGDIQWLTTVPGTEDSILYHKRDERNFVADNIIKDLDSATSYLQEEKTDGAGRINKWMALLLQSRIALYEGTWEKYHNETAFGVPNPDTDKYFEKAVEAATKVMNSNLYNIYSSGSPDNDYYDLFSTQRDYSSNSEVMFWKKYDNDLGKGESNFQIDRNYRQRVPDEHSFTKELADSYLCTDGHPISESPLFEGYSSIAKEGQNRDPRFNQTIGVPGTIWLQELNGTEVFYDSIYSVLNTGSQERSPAGYVMRKGQDYRKEFQIPQFEETPTIIYRYAEVLLNFIEAKAELGEITQEDIDMSIKLLRDRVGMPNLILSNITHDAHWDFPNLSPVLNEIRRERRVELVMEGFRFDDIMRWAAADQLIVGKRPHGFKASQLNENPYSVDEDGFLDPFKNQLPNGYGFHLERDYLKAIPKSQLVLNPALKQNPGWDE